MGEGDPGADNVADREDREKEPYPADLQALKDHVLLAESRESLVPDGGQQLLDIGVSIKLGQEVICQDSTGGLILLTLFCLYLIASFSLFRCILSPCYKHREVLLSTILNIITNFLGKQVF